MLFTFKSLAQRFEKINWEIKVAFSLEPGENGCLKII